jgi:hypothetical protein
LRALLIAIAILIDPLLIALWALLAWHWIVLVLPTRLGLTLAFLVRLLLVRHG